MLARPCGSRTTSAVSASSPEAQRRGQGDFAAFCAFCPIKSDDYIAKGEKRHMLVHKRFFGDIDTAEGFGLRMYAAVQDHGVAHDGHNCDLLADDAPWIWNLKAEHLPQARETVDWYHAKEHIFTTAHAFYGEGTQAATAWADARAVELWRERHGKVLAALRSTRPRTTAAQEAVAELIAISPRIVVGCATARDGRLDYLSAVGPLRAESATSSRTG